MLLFKIIEALVNAWQHTRWISRLVEKKECHHLNEWQRDRRYNVWYTDISIVSENEEMVLGSALCVESATREMFVLTVNVQPKIMNKWQNSTNSDNLYYTIIICAQPNDCSTVD